MKQQMGDLFTQIRELKERPSIAAPERERPYIAAPEHEEPSTGTPLTAGQCNATFEDFDYDDFTRSEKHETVVVCFTAVVATALVTAVVTSNFINGFQMVAVTVDGNILRFFKIDVYEIIIDLPDTSSGSRFHGDEKSGSGVLFILHFIGVD